MHREEGVLYLPEFLSGGVLHSYKRISLSRSFREKAMTLWSGHWLISWLEKSSFYSTFTEKRRQFSQPGVRRANPCFMTRLLSVTLNLKPAKSWLNLQNSWQKWIFLFVCFWPGAHCQSFMPGLLCSKIEWTEGNQEGEPLGLSQTLAQTEFPLLQTGSLWLESPQFPSGLHIFGIPSGILFFPFFFFLNWNIIYTWQNAYIFSAQLNNMCLNF